MKYVLIILFTFMSTDNKVERTFVEVEMSSREACYEAIEVTQQELIERYPNALALTVECRPQTPWDSPISMSELLSRDIIVAKQ